MEVDPEVEFTMPMVRAPRALASLSAASVSAVSPDWLIAITRVPSWRTGFRYRNSEAYSTSTGIPASSSSMYSPRSAACQLVPQAMMTIRVIFASSSSLSVMPPKRAIPSSSISRPLITSRRESGCSKISFIMKWS